MLCCGVSLSQIHPYLPSCLLSTVSIYWVLCSISSPPSTQTPTNPHTHSHISLSTHIYISTQIVTTKRWYCCAVPPLPTNLLPPAICHLPPPVPLPLPRLPAILPAGLYSFLASCQLERTRVSTYIPQVLNRARVVSGLPSQLWDPGP